MTFDLFHPDFLLETETARRLYHGYAEGVPIIDYHNHLPPEQVANNHKFSNITEIWLAGDHYKWRAMRSNGVSEHYCTGRASDYEKFLAWARTVPNTIRNPLHHWTHLELKFPFGIQEWLNETTAKSIYDRTNAKLATDDFTAQGLLKQFKVLVVCTTDDPTDTLEHHIAHAKSRASEVTRMVPTWRPDAAMAVEEPDVFNRWVDRLSEVSRTNVRTFDELMSALEIRHSYFHDLGCRASDHGLETAYAEPYNLSEVKRAFDTLRSGQPITEADALKYKSALMHEFGLMDHQRGWAQQLHLGALRNNNSRMFERLGRDKGFDSIGDFEVARPLARFLDQLDRKGQLPKTILYNLNPRDNEIFATMLGNFQDGLLPGKMQYGSAWWFLDQLDGMEKQINALSNLGLLSRFIGMLTDSRSFLSFSRHDYFRRLLCNIFGRDVHRGLIPNDEAFLGNMLTDICFRNVRDYFGFVLPASAPEI
jgi:glucuronate isomerase